jgi:hypothetical protein
MRRLSKTLLAVAMANLLIGCATRAERQFQSIKATNQQNLAQLKACTDAVHNLPEYTPLRVRMPNNAQSITLEQLAETSRATAEEARAIFGTHPRLQECRKTFLNGVAQSEPSLVPIFTAAYSKADDAALSLAQRKITWGDYIRGLRDRAAEMQTAIQAEDRHVVSGLKEEHEAELARRQRAADAIAAWAQTQQIINAANRPVITNCNRFGSMVNCVTQ